MDLDMKRRQIFMPKEILIVDDEPGIVVPIQFLMEQQGYHVMTAQRGDEALDLIYKYKPDLVLLDIMLPGIDGFKVCEIVRLNPNYREMKILFLSIKDREVYITKCLALGADAYITKPFSNDKLVEKIKVLLEQSYELAAE
jgi:DNA-binding response OmpR family regulator